MPFEELLTYAAVISAATYAAWRLVPGTLRTAFAGFCLTLARRVGLADSTAELILRRAIGTGRQACGACTGCSNRRTPESRVVTIRQQTDRTRGGNHHAGSD